MALTADSSDYTSAIDSSSITENWIFELRNSTYTDGSANTQYMRLALTESGSGATKYHSFITNKPAIRESINLEKGTSSVSNVTIEVNNDTLANFSKTVAEEIYKSSGSRNYINRDVIIKSEIGGYTQTIYTGRLKDVKMSGQDKVTLAIAVHNPITDDIIFPLYQSKSGNYFPVIYDNLCTPETSTVSTASYVDSAFVIPLEVDTIGNGTYNCLAHKALTDGRLHYPVKDTFNSDGYPMFVPLDDIQSNTSHDDYEGATDDTNRNVMITDLDLDRKYLIRPQTVSDPSSETGLTVANPSYAYASSGVLTNATLTFSSTATIQAKAEWDITDIVREEHSLQSLTFSALYDIDSYNEPSGGSESLTILFRLFTKFAGETSYSVYEDIVSATANTGGAYTTITQDLFDTSDYSNSVNQIPEGVKLRISFIQITGNGGGSGDTGTATVALKDMYFTVRTKIEDETDNSSNDVDVPQLANSTAVTNIKRLYTGADGLTRSWDTGNTVATLVEMHRDLLYRFAGYTTAPTNYSTLNSARATWRPRYWTHKSTKLKEVLNKCAFEGGFVFRFRPATNIGHYIFIPNSPTTQHYIRKQDITSLDISVTPFDKLVTKRIMKYYTNPINDKALLEQTSEDTTNAPRTTYNIASAEKVETTELKILAGGIGATNMGSGDRNDGFANYYNAITGLPKLVISTEIINAGDSSTARNDSASSFYYMEVGDFVEFDNSNKLVEPFGDAFNGKQFIVISLTRGIGTLKVTLREV